MQIKITRSQRKGGIMGGKIIFMLDMRAEYTEKERETINKYNLGGEVIYNSADAQKHLEDAGNKLADGKILGGFVSVAMARMKLNITILSLKEGVHIECKDLAELLEAEKTVREACQNLVGYLSVAQSFDGRVDVVEINEQTAAG